MSTPDSDDLCRRIGHDEQMMAASTLTRDSVTLRCLRCGRERIITAVFNNGDAT